jgi:hypothetical protein
MKNLKKGGAILSSIKSQKAFKYFTNNATDIDTFDSGASGSVLMRLKLPFNKQTPYYSVRSSSFGSPIRTMLFKAVLTIDDTFFNSKKDSFSKMYNNNFNVESYEYLSLTHENIIAHEFELHQLIIDNNLKDDTADIDPMCPYVFYKSKLSLDEMLDKNLSNTGYDELIKKMKSILSYTMTYNTNQTLDDFFIHKIEEELKNHIWITIIAMEFLDGLTSFSETYSNIYPVVLNKNLNQSLNYCSALNMKYLEFINMARYGCLHLDYHSTNTFVTKYENNYYEGITGRVIPIDFGRGVRLNESDVKNISELYSQNDIDGTLSYIEKLYKRIKDGNTDYCMMITSATQEQQFKEIFCDMVHDQVTNEFELMNNNDLSKIVELHLDKINSSNIMNFHTTINNKYDSFYKNYTKSTDKKVFSSCAEMLDDYLPKVSIFFELPESIFDISKAELISICKKEEQDSIDAYARERLSGLDVTFVLDSYILRCVNLRIQKILLKIKYDKKKQETEELYKDVVPEEAIPILELHEKRLAQIRINVDDFNKACTLLEVDTNFLSFKADVLNLDALKMNNENVYENLVLNYKFTKKILPLLKKFNPLFERDILQEGQLVEIAAQEFQDEEEKIEFFDAKEIGGSKNKKTRRNKRKTSKRRKRSTKHN